MAGRNRKSKIGDIAFTTANFTVLTLFMLLCAYPFYYIFIYSISDPIQAAKGVLFTPLSPTLSNYSTIFLLPGIANAAFISILRTVIGTSIMVFCSSFFGYLVTLEKLFLRKTIYRFMIITMYFNAGLIPWYLVMRALHLYNNFFVYIIPGAVAAFHVILVKTYIEQLPQGLQDSAKVDGAGYFTIFTKLIFPISLPIIATITVFGALTQWNSWFDNLLLVRPRNLKTLQLILWEYVNRATAIWLEPHRIEKEMLKSITPRAIRMTITMVVTLPIVFVYPYMQRYFLRGIMVGAMKG